MLKEIEQIESTSDDPLLVSTPLPLRAVFYPLGFAVEIHTNSKDILTAAQESWGMYKQEFFERPVEIRVGVAGNTAVCSAVPFFRSQRHLLSIVSDNETFGLCDLSKGFGYCWTTPGTAKNRPFFRYHFLEGIALCLLGQLYWTPVHAACVALHGKGLLLCAQSGTGKSSLALACARAGWTFISDDAAELIRSRRDRTVVGNPYHMRFRESACKLFPDLRQRLVKVRGNGKVGIELPTAELGIKTATQSTVDHIIFLQRRSSGPARLEHFSKDEAFELLSEVARYGEAEVRDAQIESVRHLLAGPVCALSYSDLDSAVERLRLLVETGRD
jgi:hypothetical protein